MSPCRSLHFPGQVAGSLARIAPLCWDPKVLRPIRSPLHGLDEATRQTKGGEVRVVAAAPSKSRRTSLRLGHCASRRHARDALAPQCRRMAVLDQGQGAHDGVQYGPNASPWISIPATSAMSNGTLGIPGECRRYHMMVLEVFRSSYFADVSLSDWLARTPPALVAQHLNVDVATIAKFPTTSRSHAPVIDGATRPRLAAGDQSRSCRNSDCDCPAGCVGPKPFARASSV